MGRPSSNTRYSDRARSARVLTSIIAKSKSYSSANSRRRSEARRTRIPSPSSAMDRVPDRVRRAPQMGTARGRDGGQT